MTSTPGPWTVREQSTQYPDLKTYMVLAPNPDHGKSGVCYSGQYFGVAGPLDSRDDAYLIAAAPALLEACKKALTCASINSDVRELIRAAIRQAEGV